MASESWQRFQPYQLKVDMTDLTYGGELEDIQMVGTRWAMLTIYDSTHQAVDFSLLPYVLPSTTLPYFIYLSPRGLTGLRQQ